MSSLQIALIVAGVVLVAGVIAYNGWQERRYRRSLEGGARGGERFSADADPNQRVEPTLHAPGRAAEASQVSSGATAQSGSVDAAGAASPDAPPRAFAAGEPDAGEEEQAQLHAGTHAPAGAGATALAARRAPEVGAGDGGEASPDGEIECVIALQPVGPVSAGALAAGLHARVGKPLRWFGRSDAHGAWQRLTSDTPGRHAEVVACMLLADRNGAASTAQIEAFSRIVGDIAPLLPAAFVPPDVSREAARAEALDRLCAALDVQIGLTVQRPEAGAIPGTRLRGVAEASGFHLAPAGRFEFASEDTGAILYSLQNLRPEPFSAESLRLTATHGVVFLLDVARVADPTRVFDQMKMAAKRMATTLGGQLVDDNGRLLDDVALALIRDQVQAAADALESVNIEPGSARALALFGA
ncbi:MAG: cell division protein ZipA C-terminal FtsZ-binding domain-containing protein [Betaproteobacteria bacterium]